MILKQLPSNELLESALLGYMLVNGEEIEKIFIDYGFQLEHISNGNYKNILNSIYQMLIDGKQIDIITIDAELSSEVFYKNLGGNTYLVELCESYETGRTIITIIDNLKLLYQKREIIKQARILEEVGYNSQNIEGDINVSYEKINNVLMEGNSKSTTTEENIVLLEKYIEDNRHKDLIGYSWGKGLEWFDNATGGIRKAKTYRIGGLSGTGKTTFIYQLMNGLLKQDLKVLFVSLENTVETTLLNFLSTEQKVNPKLIEKGIVKPDLKFLRKYKNNFLLTDKLTNLNEIKREILKVKPDVVFLDYIGLVEMNGYDEKSKYDKYADEIKNFMQKNQWLSWIDLSNLNKSDTEETIRMYGGFNGSAKLRNNTDFALHIFPYKPFSEYKKLLLVDNDKEKHQGVLGKKVNTFLITKSRLGDDGIEKQYLIDFNKGIKYKEATEEQISKFNTLI